MENDTLLDTIHKLDEDIVRLMAERTKLAGSLDTRSSERLERETEQVIADSGRKHGLEPDICTALINGAKMRAMAARSTHMTDSPKKVTIVGGAGKMGKWTSDFLTAIGHDVTAIDPAAGNGLTLKDCADSDMVIVSVPIHAADGVLRELDGICRKDALIFDLTSLKSPVIETLRKMAETRDVCSIHPMFGPSATSIVGRNLIVCDCGNAFAVKEVTNIFGGRGCNIRVMDVEDHDMYMSYVLGLSHAVNIAFFTALDRSGIPFRDMQTVASTTFRKNLDTNASVALEDPMLYYEIQHLNQHRDEMWGLFSDAVRDLKDASLSSDPSGFVELMENGRRYFSE